MCAVLVLVFIVFVLMGQILAAYTYSRAKHAHTFTWWRTNMGNMQQEEHVILVEL